VDLKFRSGLQGLDQAMIGGRPQDDDYDGDGLTTMSNAKIEEGRNLWDQGTSCRVQAGLKFLEATRDRGRRQWPI
jgi:hypothetical protein